MFSSNSFSMDDTNPKTKCQCCIQCTFTTMHSTCALSIHICTCRHHTTSQKSPTQTKIRTWYTKYACIAAGELTDFQALAQIVQLTRDSSQLMTGVPIPTTRNCDSGSEADSTVTLSGKHSPVLNHPELLPFN